MGPSTTDPGILSVRGEAQGNDMDSTDSAASPSPRRVLVLNVRGLSPFFLGAYGNEWVHAPNCDRLASRGVVFDQHFATDVRPGSSCSPLPEGEGLGGRVQAFSLSQPRSR